MVDDGLTTQSVTVMKNTFGLFAVETLIVTLCFGCSMFADREEISFAEQSGTMLCLVKQRTPAVYKLSYATPIAELFIGGRPFQPEEFPDIKFKGCHALSKKLMSVTAEYSGDFLWFEQADGFKFKKLDATLGNLSNDLQWFVTQEKMNNPVTNEEIVFKTELPGEFLGNSPDWKTIITRGEDLLKEDLISLYVVDVETGVAKKRFVRRADYLFLLDDEDHFGIGSQNLWISNHFGWLPDETGKFRLVYPVLEPDEIKNKKKN